MENIFLVTIIFIALSGRQLNMKIAIFINLIKNLHIHEYNVTFNTPPPTKERMKAKKIRKD